MNKISTKIYFDMDGVLADFDLVVKEIYDKDLNFSSGLMKKDDLLSKQERWKIIEKTDGFWINMPKIKGIEKLLKIAKEKGQIFVLTKTPGANNFVTGQDYVDFVKSEKIEWINKNFPEFFKSENIIVVNGSKGDFINPDKDHILIDDRIENIKDWALSGGSGVLFESVDSAISELTRIC